MEKYKIKSKFKLGYETKEQGELKTFEGEIENIAKEDEYYWEQIENNKILEL
jgi:hypothetical protein